MPRQEQVLTVFVASPADVGDERTKLEEVINELNVTWSRELGIRLDLVRWETHTFPGMGEDAQDVINEQIPDDYDLFVGIMWCRYGTPTGRSGSGTVEEFERAKARYDADSSSVQLMVYFKDEAVPPSRLDPIQLAKVNKFRDSLGEKGALYHFFGDVDSFEKLIRFHLTRQVQEWKKRFQNTDDKAHQDETTRPIDQEQEEDSLEDPGILDLIEIFEDQFGELANIAERIGEATEDLGDKMDARTSEIEEASSELQGNISRKLAKRLVAKAANDMNQYSVRIEAELPLFSTAFNSGIDAFTRSMAMSVKLGSDAESEEEARQVLEAIISAGESFRPTREMITGLRGTIADLPPLTSKLNRAKRGVVSVLDRLAAEFTNGETLLGEAETVMRESLDE